MNSIGRQQGIKKRHVTKDAADQADVTQKLQLAHELHHSSMLVSILDRKPSFNFPLHDVSVFLILVATKRSCAHRGGRMLAWCYGRTRLYCLSPTDRRFDECTSRCGH